MLVTDHLASSSSSQWLFPVSALSVTPSITTSGYTLDKELYDRARGVEFLFRLGSSLGLSALSLYALKAQLHLSSHLSCPRKGLPLLCSPLQLGFIVFSCAIRWKITTVR